MRRFLDADLSTQSSIVAVHGLNGDAMKTWTSGNICWLNHPDLLPKYLKRARVLTWGYNANISSLTGKSTSSERILQHAQTRGPERSLRSLYNLDRKSCDAGLSHKPCDVIFSRKLCDFSA
jgi:hypothetical protein